MKKTYLFIKDKFVNPKSPFSDRLFFMFGSAGMISALAAFVAAVMSQLPIYAVMTSFVSFFVMLAIMVTALFAKDLHLTRLLCASFLNFFMFPVLFLFTGGANSGMMFYFMLGLCVATLILDGKERLIILVLGLVLHTALLTFGFNYPEKIYALTYEERMSDTLASFVIVSLFIIAVIVIVTREYSKEHKKVVDYNEILQQEAITDPLTTLYNQRYLVSALEEFISNHDSSKPAASMIMFDIDDFKMVNDTRGHICGNQVLCQFAQILKEKSGDHNTAVRYGGEEFIIFLPECDGNVAYSIAEEVRKAAIEDRVLQELVKGTFTVSGGVAEYDHGQTAEQWINVADKHLYEAKRLGKNQVVM